MSVSAKLQQSLVSVIIPTYNRPFYLKQAIASVVKQTYQNIEIIVYDDCSLENPQEIIESFQDPRIVFRRNPTNLGIAITFVNALQEARGKYISTLNDDDLWKEDYLEKLVSPLDANPEIVLSFCDHDIINQDGEIDISATEKNSKRWKRTQLKEGIYQPFYEMAVVHQSVSPASSAVIRKDVVDWNLPSEAGINWDLYVAYLCCRTGRGAYYYPQRLTQYRVHSGNITQSSTASFDTIVRQVKHKIYCFECLMKDKTLQEFQPYFKMRWAKQITSLGIVFMRNKQVSEARPYFLYSLSQRLSFRSLAALLLSFMPPSLASKF